MWGVLLGLSLILAGTTADIPGCDYFDTVDLSNTPQLPEGSYKYGNVEIPRERTGNFTYRMLINGTKESPLPSYVRGCICQLKPCVLFCCQPEKAFLEQPVTMQLLNGTEIETMDYVVQVAYEVSCESVGVEPLKPDDERIPWNIFENGFIYNSEEGPNRAKNEYCLVPMIEDGEYKLVPNFISNGTKNEKSLLVSLGNALRSVSIFCMILINATYLYLPRYRSLSDLCRMCYYICLSVAFTMVSLDTLIRLRIPTWMCALWGYAGYFAVMSTFLWLLVINTDMWKSIRMPVSRNTSSAFRRYSILVWSGAAALLLPTALLDFMLQSAEEPVDEDWIPGVGVYTCWVNTESNSAMIYFYGPICVILLINVGFFSLTTRKIYKDRKETKLTFTLAETKRNKKNRANFGLFLRIFLLNGIVWLVEIISYLLRKKDLKDLRDFGDILIFSHGIALFFIAVVKRPVLKHIYERMNNGNSKKNELTVTNTTEVS